MNLPETVRNIYAGSDGEATQRLYKELEKRGHIGTVAVNLFRAQKSSSRAKVYRGGIRGKGSYKRMAYDRKSWSLSNLCDVLARHASALSIRYGWKEDSGTVFAGEAAWVLYVDLPTGQVSFHSPHRGSGPAYTGDWDCQHKSAERIIEFCEQLLAAEVVQ